ncbi:MAG: SAM-dependent methyltransferase [Spirochaetota bacterium]|nr:SAM-dependent methyltransferase [Spirochaetota bacterium]
MDTITIAVKPSEQDIGALVEEYLKSLDKDAEFELLVLDETRDAQEGDSLLRAGKARFVLEELENEPGYFPVDKSFLITTLPGGHPESYHGDRDGVKPGCPLSRGKYGLRFRRNDAELIKWMSPYFGKVAFVGAGAGNKELLTIKGRKKVERADVVISDFLLDQAILKSYCRKDSLIIPLTKYGHRTKKNLVTQDEINETILRYALLDRSVVRLKGGDSFVFGRGGEECEYLLPLT